MSDLPPLEEPQAYVVVGPDDQRGPYTMELLIGEVLAGRLSEATPVWWPGLGDWTTMGGHAGVAGEIERRRSASSAPAPGWADPTPTGAPQPTYEQQTYEQQTYGAQGYEQPSYEQPSYEQPSYGTQGYEQPSYEQHAGGFGGLQGVASPADDVIDVDPIGVAPGESAPRSVAAHDQAAFDQLVVRSATRSAHAERIAAAEESFVDAVVDAASATGLTVTGRDRGESAYDLRLDDTHGTQVVVLLGRFPTSPTEDLGAAVVPLQVSAHASGYGVNAHSSTGQHGEVVVTTDEWTGQASSSVALLLGLDDYVDAGLVVDRGSVGRDVGAVIAVVRGRLG